VTKEERIDNDLSRARFLHDQARFAESRLKYEHIIVELRPKKKTSKKTPAG